MKYAALLYCWGTLQTASYTTTKETIELRKTRIVYEELPFLLACGVSIARTLGVTIARTFGEEESGRTYLWVDAICII
jgi:hypothetical protein